MAQRCPNGSRSEPNRSPVTKVDGSSKGVAPASTATRERHGLSVRALQRLFRGFVGVGPKWVLQRYRLHDAVTAIDTDPGAMADLAGLAASLGWSDQSHFTRDFTAAVGVSPHAYAARPV